MMMHRSAPRPSSELMDAFTARSRPPRSPTAMEFDYRRVITVPARYAGRADAAFRAELRNYPQIRSELHLSISDAQGGSARIMVYAEYSEADQTSYKNAVDRILSKIVLAISADARK